MLNIYHPGAMGDMIYSLPGTRLLCQEEGSCIYCTKPINNKRSRRQSFHFIKPLLEAQPYIREYVCLDEGMTITHDFNPYRKLSDIKTEQHLAQTHLEIFGLEADLSKPWLEGVEPKKLPQPIIVSYTGRYHNYDSGIVNRNEVDEIDNCVLFLKKQGFDLDSLKKRKKDVFFVGKNSDLWFFSHLTKTKFQGIECKDAMEFAQIIKGARLFVGNQSLGLAIAEALKRPRACEYYSPLDNCKPQSENGHRFLTDDLIEHYLQSEEPYKTN